MSRVWYTTECGQMGTYTRINTIEGGGVWSRRTAPYGASFNKTDLFQDRPKPFSGLQSQCNNTLLQTPHSAGMMVGIADGSVRCVTAKFAPNNWSAAVHPSDGNVFSWE